jgi:hypothetical protein
VDLIRKLVVVTGRMIPRLEIPPREKLMEMQCTHLTVSS